MTQIVEAGNFVLLIRTRILARIGFSNVDQEALLNKSINTYSYRICLGIDLAETGSRNVFLVIITWRPRGDQLNKVLDSCNMLIITEAETIV